jgi:DNA-binding transcriptional ArsR family regulator
MTNPVRFNLAAALAEEPMSAADLARKTEIPVEKVRYHLRALVKDGVVETREETPRRGVMERLYVAARDLIVDDEDIASLPTKQRQRIAAVILGRSLKEASAAMVSGPLSSRPNQHCVRVPLEVDEQGWSELAEIHSELFQRILSVKAEARKRLEGVSTAAIRATSTIFFYERVAAANADAPD